MDIYTERGQEFETLVEKMTIDLESALPGWTFFKTPTPFGEKIIRHEVGAHFDGFAFCSGEIKYIFEVKTRTQKIADFEKWGSFMVSHSKILNGSRISETLKTPFYILFNLYKERAVFQYEITDSKGRVIIDHVTETKKTQKNCNGGRKIDVVAYLPIDKARKIFL